MKIFKYSVLAIDNPEEGCSQEISFEDQGIIEADEKWVLKIASAERTYRVTSVKRIDHVLFPNDPFDYRLFAVGVN